METVTALHSTVRTPATQVSTMQGEALASWRNAHQSNAWTNASRHMLIWSSASLGVFSVVANPYEQLHHAPKTHVPAINSATWTDSSYRHPTMMSLQVREFLVAKKDADADSLQYLYDAARQQFFDVRPDMEYRFRTDRETGEPKLFLTVDTHGMDLPEVLRREVALQEQIANSPALQAATAYHVISAV